VYKPHGSSKLTRSHSNPIRLSKPLHSWVIYLITPSTVALRWRLKGMLSTATQLIRGIQERLYLRQLIIPPSETTTWVSQLAVSGRTSWTLQLIMSEISINVILLVKMSSWAELVMLIMRNLSELF